MNEDYLWNKTGEDPEIQSLENALKTFRYQETAPPELPAPFLTIAEEKPRRFFQWRFAVAAFASVLAILSIVWLQIANKQISPVGTVAEINAPMNVSETSDKFVEIKPAVEIIRNNAENNIQPTAKAVKTIQKLAPVVRQNKLAAVKAKSIESSEKLTAKEKYAYDQLMLALSVTSSSLKIVKDTVNGIEDKTAVLETAK